MLVIQICLVIITLCALAVAFVAITRIAPLALRARQVVEQAGPAIDRMHGVLGELEAMVRDARATETRVTSVVRGIVDRLEPPLTQLAAVVAGVSAAITAVAKFLPGLGPRTGGPPERT